MTSDRLGRALGSVMRDVNAVLAAHPPPAGVRVEIGGQYANQRAAFRDLLIVLALAGGERRRGDGHPVPELHRAAGRGARGAVVFVGAVVLLLVTGTPLNVRARSWG